MPDIKTRETVKGTIKALDRSAIAAQRMKKAYIQSKEKAEHSIDSSESTPEEYAADRITDTAQGTVHEVIYHGERVIHTGISGIKKTAETTRNRSDPISAKEYEVQVADSPTPFSVTPNGAPLEIETEMISKDAIPRSTAPHQVSPVHGQESAIPPAYKPTTPSISKTDTPIFQPASYTVQSSIQHTTVVHKPKYVPHPTPASTHEKANNITPKVRYTRSAKTIKVMERNRDHIKQTIWSTGKSIICRTKESTKIRPRTIRTPHTLSPTPVPPTQLSTQTVQAGVQSHRTALQTIHCATQKAVSSAKSISVAAKSAVNSIIARTQAMISTLAAGGSVAMIVIILILMIGLISGSSYGIFFSGEETGNGMTMRSVVREINNEYQAMIEEIKNSIPHDALETSGSQAAWAEVLSVYAVRVSTDPYNPMEVTSMDDTKKAILEEIFWAMNEISYRTETHAETEITDTIDEDGNIIETEITITKRILYITISHRTAVEMAAEYHFTEAQLETLGELLSEDNTRLWFGVLYGIHSGSTDIVAVAASQLGNVGGEPYWRWYGFTSRVEWCACFVSWCANECGYVEEGIVPKFAGCVLGAQWFKDHRQWAVGSYEPPPGAIIFFDWDGDGRSDHVGIVEKVENGVVYTIEGNSGDACRQRSYPVGWYEIYGYGLSVY